MYMITISGVSKSGKTSIIKLLNEKTDNEHYILDSDPTEIHTSNVIKHRVYDVHQLSKYLSFQNKFSNFVDLAVCLKVDKIDLSNRLILSHHEFDSNIIEHQKYLITNFKHSDYKNELILDTSINSLDECVNIILDKIEELSN